MAIIRGTTPRIQFVFSEIDLNDIEVAYLTIKEGNQIKIEKTLAEAQINENIIEWKLSQSDTFSLNEHKTVEICCDWKLVDGTRGRSHRKKETVERTGKNEVL